MLASLPHEPPHALARLIAISGPLRGEVLPLWASGTAIGRDTSNTISVSDIALSRSHCTIVFVDGAWRIRDRNSSNGTFVNGDRVAERTLADRDRIDLGESTFIFVQGARSAEVPAVDELPSSVVARLDVTAKAYSGGERGATPGAEAQQRLRALLSLSTAVNTLASDEALFERILDVLCEALPADQAAIVAVDRSGEARVAAVRQCNGTPAVALSRPVFTQAMHERTGLLTCETSSAPHQSIVCVPLVARDRSIAAIHLTTSRQPPFDEEHLQFATAVANVSAPALDNVRHVAWLREERVRLQRELEQNQLLVGQSAAMEHVYATVAKVARSDATVLITGETGTGKELVARSVHGNSARAQRPFVAVNCAALTDSLLETELFGHERGAFTGAHTQKKGKLEVADGGTLFLDEIGELPASLQSKLLRALQLHEFDRVGGTRPVHVDIRVIAATNRDLASDVAAGRFRSDLYHRLHVIDIHVPPLRDRRDDIPMLARYFVDRFARTAARQVRGIAPDALAYLMSYEWPGNVRELENTIERAIVLGWSDHILATDLPEALLEAAAPPGSERSRFHETVRDAKVRAIVEAFRDAKGSYTDTARLLGLNANYLHRLIKNLQLKQVLERER